MRVSLNWIKRLLNVEDLGMSPEVLVEKLTVQLGEIDDLERTGPSLNGVVIGKVLSCEQHPNADRLRVTSVDIGKENALSIVCGAPNVAAGQTVAVATVGTTLTMCGADGTEESLTIKKGKLRGVASHGMICAEDELGLGGSHDGIMVLDDALTAGCPLADAIPLGGDDILIVDNHNINHRPDLWGHLGWAREIAPVCNLSLPQNPDISWEAAPNGWDIQLKDDNVIAYHGAVINGVSNAHSPQWMQDLLIAAGIRPLGLLVDITNFVMLELGEPMHAFSKEAIAGTTLFARAATAEEQLTALDETELTLAAGDLVIADEKQPLALAGIMGGLSSMVHDNTTSIVLEAATFAAGQIRRTRMSTGLGSESSNRFEKSLFPELAPAAINKAITLLTECCPGCTVDARFAAGCMGNETRQVHFNPDAVARSVGIDVPAETQQQYLEQLGFVADQSGETLQVPWWRYKDISEAVDLIEEVARLHGYDALTPEVPRLPASTPTPNILRMAEHRSRQILSALSWDEVATYCFTSETWADALMWPEEKRIRLQHALSSEQTVMRASMLPTLAEAMGRNRKNMANAQFYEIGKVYSEQSGDGVCAHESLVLAGIISEQNNDTPFYAARDAALHVLESLGISGAALHIPKEEQPDLQNGRAAFVQLGKKVIGRIGEVPATLRKVAGVQDACAWFSLDLERIIATRGDSKPISFTPPSRFQAVEREYTFVCPEQLSWSDLAGAVRKGAGGFCREVELVTIYRGEQIDTNNKAVSLRIILQSDDKTLSEKDLSKAQRKIIGTVENTTTAKLRA